MHCAATTVANTTAAVTLDAPQWQQIAAHELTLVPPLRDESCLDVLSIDKRPQVQPDSRGAGYDYKECTTARMKRGLAQVAGVDLQKLQCFEGDARDCTPLGAYGLAFIDGEHTTTLRGTYDELAAALVDAICPARLELKAAILINIRDLGAQQDDDDPFQGQALAREHELAGRVAPLGTRRRGA